MQWYDNGKFYLSGDQVRTAAKGSTVDRVEYAEMKQVKALATKVTVLEERESKIVKQVGDDRQNIEDAFDQIRYNYQAVQDLRWRIKELEDAPKAAKRKRRVTICAGGQKVEIIRVDN